MDLLQIGLIFLILLMGVSLSVLGIQVFFILKDLKRSLDKLELFLDEAITVTGDLEKPVRAAAEVTEVLENGVRVVKSLGAKGQAVSERLRTSKSAKRLFKR
jgi:hypothetical protein